MTVHEVRPAGIGNAAQVLPEGEAGPAGKARPAGEKGTASGPEGVPGGGQPPAEAGRPELEKPRIGMADMTVELMTIQDLLARQSLAVSRTLLEDRRLETRRLNDERSEQLEKWLEKLKEMDSKSKGFFGRLFRVVKNVFQGDFKGAKATLEEAFRENPVTAVLFTAATLPLVCIGGPAGLAASAVLFAPEIMGDPEIGEALAKSMARSFHTDLETARKWTMAVGIVTTFVWTVAAMGSDTVRRIVVPAYQGEAAVRNLLAAKSGREAQDLEADMDVTRARQETIQTFAEKDLELMRCIVESVSRNTKAAMEILTLQAETGLSVSRSMGLRKRV